MYIPSGEAPEEQVRFYVDELGLFEVAQDYGMGQMLLRCRTSPSFCLLLQPGRPVMRDTPVFTLSTSNARAELARLTAVRFTRGGLVVGRDGVPGVWEYPLGTTFSLRDAVGNLFGISQWHPSAF
ncbi:hypothetical protein ACQKGO_09630 [Corallococcus interemptor]|uniref:hypothetical protein n=1 Tax=Corallococcus interemptor TaxID=2316720 RepID=UPI003D048690